MEDVGRGGSICTQVATVPMGSKVRSLGKRGIKGGSWAGVGSWGWGLTVLELDSRKDPETSERFRLAEA